MEHAGARKERETRPERDLRRSVKMEVVEKLADSIAHQMNNVLATVMGLASVLESELDPGSLMFQDVQGISSAARRGLELTRNLMGFSEGIGHRRNRISPNRLVGIVGSLLKRSISRDVELQMLLADDLADIEGDPIQLRHVLVNLTANAADAIHGKGTITISTKNVVLGEGEQASVPDLAPGRYVCIQVSDTGAGMDQETLEQAFDPFFTTKPAGAGPGLGLLLVYGIVQRHRGKVGIVSKEGLGTTVTIHIPAIDLAPEVPMKPPETQKALHRGDGIVLLVDDEAQIRITGKRLLEKLGYTVLLAESGREALEIYRQKQEEILLVLLDVIMPEMDGSEVFKKLKEINPDARIVISSGYPNEELFDEMTAEGAAGFVQKPYTLRQLSRELEDAIESPRVEGERP